MVVDGRRIRDEILEEVKRGVEEFKRKTRRGIKLGVIYIGNDPSTEIYIRNKRKVAEEVGITIEISKLENEAGEGEMIAKVEEFNARDDITAFIIQLPLPSSVDSKKVRSIINTYKDVDCLNPENLGKVAQDNALFTPCAALAMREVLERYNVEVESKEAVIIGASDIVGKPCALILLNKMATVTICQIMTRDIRSHVQRADILVAGAGVPNLIKGDWIKEGTVVIDIGTNVVGNKVVGDVEFEKASKKASLITPVPGGIGAITVAELMRNTLKATWLNLEKA